MERNNKRIRWCIGFWALVTVVVAIVVTTIVVVFDPTQLQFRGHRPVTESEPNEIEAEWIPTTAPSETESGVEIEAQVEAEAVVKVERIAVTEESILATYHHDGNAYTQGLFLDSDNTGHLIESTGQYGDSTIRRVHYGTGEVLLQNGLDDRVFGEGCVRWKDAYIILLTWKSKRGFVIDPIDLSIRREFRYQTSTGEGWGITHDGHHLIVSDGSSYLQFWDPVTFVEVESKRVQVTIATATVTVDVDVDVEQGEGESGQRRTEVRKLNELEYVRGEVYANVWETPYIYRIDPATGFVTGIIDCSLLYEKAGVDVASSVRSGAVLNGIAAIQSDNDNNNDIDDSPIRLLLTGKLWNLLFEIDVARLE